MTVGLQPSCSEIPSVLPAPVRDFSKRFSVPRQLSEHRVTIRPYESFRDRKDSEKPQITFGFAALSTDGERKESGENGNIAGRVSPAPSIFSIYGDDPGPSTICEQPVGAQADVYISSLGEKNRHLLKKFLENSPRQENQYFIWIKDHKTNKFTIISIKTLENHLNSTHRIRRVKWRHRSMDHVSIYRYSIPSITYKKSKMACSLNPEDRNHPYLHYNTSTTQLTLQTLRNITIGANVDIANRLFQKILFEVDVAKFEKNYSAYLTWLTGIGAIQMVTTKKGVGILLSVGCPLHNIESSESI
ncbi:unnamed protein product [Cylicocyclus nassatus]|uniref:Uncharacterized protein n=1 Tax=Cylicocyclus nassatus TaxID=53992 RepID=A0AA36H4M1_CYLNA|nr:unnamed protein product [Cylicocyclus nassatus]